MASFYGVYAYIGDHLHRGLGLPVSAGGLLALCYGLGFGATTFLDRWIDRLGPARLLPLFFTVVGGVYLVMSAAAASYPAMLAVVFCWGMANHAALNVLILRLAALDPGRRGAIMGLNSGVTYLALFAGDHWLRAALCLCRLSGATRLRGRADAGSGPCGGARSPRQIGGQPRPPKSLIGTSPGEWACAHAAAMA